MLRSTRPVSHDEQRTPAISADGDRPSDPEVSVVIVSFNTRDLLREAIASLPQAAAGRSYETIVVDNRSHDGSAEMV